MRSLWSVGLQATPAGLSGHLTLCKQSQVAAHEVSAANHPSASPVWGFAVFRGREAMCDSPRCGSGLHGPRIASVCTSVADGRSRCCVACCAILGCSAERVPSWAKGDVVAGDPAARA